MRSSIVLILVGLFVVALFGCDSDKGTDSLEGKLKDRLIGMWEAPDGQYFTFYDDMTFKWNGPSCEICPTGGQWQVISSDTIQLLWEDWKESWNRDSRETTATLMSDTLFESYTWSNGSETHEERDPYVKKD